MVVIYLFIAAGRAEAAGALQVLASAGALGALFGYQVTVRQRRSRGIKGPLDEWAKFIGSWMSFAVMMIVILGSAVLSVLLWLVHDAIAGRTG